MRARSPRRLLSAIFRNNRRNKDNNNDKDKKDKKDKLFIKDKTEHESASEEMEVTKVEESDEEEVAVDTTTRSGTATTKTRNKDKTVSFSDVTVRQYELIVGDNPFCMYPLSLGWNSVEMDTVDVNQYEQERAKRLEQYQSDRVEPRLYQVPGSTAEATRLHNQRLGLYLSDVHMEQDYDDYDPSKPSEMSLYERRARLRAYGYTEADLRQQERYRRVICALQWRMGDAPCVSVSPYYVARYTR